jgi:hypothetical protein
MAKRIVEKVKIANAMLPVLIGAGATSATHKFFPVAGYHRVAFHVIGTAATIADDATMVLQTVQNTSAAVVGAKDIDNNTATATVPTRVIAANVAVDAGGIAANGVITINGLTFTGNATATTASKREFLVTSQATAVAGLVTCINDPVYGVPGVTATDIATTSVDLAVSEPGEATITIENADTDFTVTATALEAIVEVDASNLDIDGGYNHIGCEVTVSAAMTCSTTAIFDPRYSPGQKVAAEKYDCETP